MRILIIHNHYIHIGGEDTVFESEKVLLKKNGHDVFTFEMDNNEIASQNKVKLALNTVWSIRSQKKLDALIQQIGPDVIHVHNTFPLISPSIYWTAAAHCVPVVQTLHNFRLFCLQAMFLRNGNICESCLNRIPFRGVYYKCYRGSRLQSTAAAIMLCVHKLLGTYKQKVTRYIALNEFCRSKFIQGGLPASRICTKPNFVDIPKPFPRRKKGGLYVGRLSEEKGIDILMGAYAKHRINSLRIIGDGPLKDTIPPHEKIVYEGFCDSHKVYETMAQSLYLVMPSIWYENMPRTIVESFANGTAVIASRIGALEHLVQDNKTGLLFEPGSQNDLSRKLRWAEANPEAMLRMGKRGRLIYEEKFTSEKSYHLLLRIYREAIAEKKERKLAR